MDSYLVWGGLDVIYGGACGHLDAVLLAFFGERFLELLSLEAEDWEFCAEGGRRMAKDVALGVIVASTRHVLSILL